MITIVDGEFEVFLAGKSYKAGPGSALNFARGTPHSLRNVGSIPGKTVWFVTPGASFQAFFRKLAEVPPGPPDMTKIAALFAEYGMNIQQPPA